MNNGIRKVILITILGLTLITQSGCVLGMAYLIRWDQRRWKAQQEKIENEQKIEQEKQEDEMMQKIPQKTKDYDKLGD